MAGRRDATKVNACSYDMASGDADGALLVATDAGCATPAAEKEGEREWTGEEVAALVGDGNVASESDEEEAGSGTAAVGRVSASASSSSSSSASWSSMRSSRCG